MMPTEEIEMPEKPNTQGNNKSLTELVQQLPEEIKGDVNKYLKFLEAASKDSSKAAEWWKQRILQNIGGMLTSHEKNEGASKALLQNLRQALEAYDEDKILPN